MRAASAAFVVILGGAVQAQSYFPAPPTPAGNPVTTPNALLGMALFWEEQLSSSNTTACGTCPIFSNGGVDPRAASRLHPGADGLYGTPDDVHGAGGVPARTASGHYTVTNAFGVGPQVTSRKAPSVINASYLTNLFYDGRASQGNFRDPVTNQMVLTGPCAVENLVSDNKAKGISPVSAVTIHVAPAFSLEHWDDDRQKMGQHLLEVASPWLGSDIAEFQVHAWRYARPRHEHDHPCLILNQSPALLIAGDAFGGPRVEGAALSGWAGAEAVKELQR